jgi:hypothetical protein
MHVQAPMLAPPGPSSSVSSSDGASAMRSAGPASVMVREFSWSKTPSSDRFFDTCTRTCCKRDVQRKAEAQQPSSCGTRTKHQHNMSRMLHLKTAQHETLLRVIDAHKLRPAACTREDQHPEVSHYEPTDADAQGAMHSASPPTKLACKKLGAVCRIGQRGEALPAGGVDEGTLVPRQPSARNVTPPLDGALHMSGSPTL